MTSDLTGKEFRSERWSGSVVVTGDTGERATCGDVLWSYRCTLCGGTGRATTGNLTSGRVTRCRSCASRANATENRCVGEQRKCRHCGATFAASIAKQRYCSPKCRPGARKPRKKADPKPRTCRHCGGGFVGSSNQVCCSPECTRADRTARERERRRLAAEAE